MNRYEMTFENYAALIRLALDRGFRFMTYGDYVAADPETLQGARVLLLRHDVDADRNVIKSRCLAEIENRHGVVSTFFLRPHDPEYNLFDFESYANARALIRLGHEVGLHSEALDFGRAVAEDPASILRKEIALLQTLFDIHLRGSACHGDISQHNNLDFWAEHRPQDFGLEYEAYHPETPIFKASTYISNFQGNHWKCYERGELKQGDARTVWEHLEAVGEEETLLYNILIHPRPWYHGRHWRLG